MAPSFPLDRGIKIQILRSITWSGSHSLNLSFSSHKVHLADISALFPPADNCKMATPPLQDSSQSWLMYFYHAWNLSQHGGLNVALTNLLELVSECSLFHLSLKMVVLITIISVRRTVDLHALMSDHTLVVFLSNVALLYPPMFVRSGVCA